jgi:hypothetical protein
MPSELNCIDILTFGSSDFKIRAMVFKASFNNISAISWWSVLLVEEIRVITKLPNSEQSYKGKTKLISI